MSVARWYAHAWSTQMKKTDKTEFRRYIRATHEGSLSAEALNYLADEMFENLNTNGVCVLPWYARGTQSRACRSRFESFLIPLSRGRECLPSLLGLLKCNKTALSRES